MTTTPSSFEPPPPGSNIELARTGDLTTISIPANGYKGVARGLLVGGILWSAFVSLFVLAAMSAVLGFSQAKNENGEPVAGWIPLLTLIPFIGIGVGILLAAWHLARRRAVLLVSADTVVFTQTGPLREIEKSWPRADVRDVVVGASNTEVNDRPLMQVQLQLAGGKHYGMFTGRADAELSWLVEQLRWSLFPETAGLPPAARQAAIERTMSATRPEKSNVTIEQFAGEWKMTVPRLGVRGPALGLLIFSIVWNGFGAGVFFAIVKGARLGVPTGLLLIFGGMELIGFLVFLYALHLGVRSAQFTVAGDRFACAITGLFGGKRYEWQTGGIAAVRVADSGTKINNRPLRQLVVEPRAGRPVKMLTGRDDAELLWMAAELRKVLKVGNEEA